MSSLPNMRRGSTELWEMRRRSTTQRQRLRPFSDCFIAANPGGVICGKNDEQFRLQILQGFEFYRSIGTKSMTISGLTVTALDEFHVQARVSWQADYIKKDGSGVRIDFDVIYMLQTIGKRPKIFAYITGDEEGALRERGLI